MLPLGPPRPPVRGEVHSRGGHSSCSKQEVRTEEEKELGTQHPSQEQAPNDFTSFQEALFLKVLFLKVLHSYHRPETKPSVHGPLENSQGSNYCTIESQVPLTIEVVLTSRLCETGRVFPLLMKFTTSGNYEKWSSFMCFSVTLMQNHKVKYWGLFLREG